MQSSDNSVSSGTDLAIEVDGLSYSYKKQRALDALSFQVERGSINGFVGPNGSGKTTTLKILATLLRPRVGAVRVLGVDVVRHYKQVRRRIGFMPDNFSTYRQMTVFEYLDFFAAAYGLGLSKRNRVIADILELTDMSGRQDDLIKSLSRGMQQRVSLARVLVNDPDLLLLDEPASGLDPRARIELMEILHELRGMGKTIFISSHILSELGDLCDSFTIIDHGKAAFTGSIEQLMQREQAHVGYQLQLAEDRPGLEQTLEALPGVSTVAKAEAKALYRLSFDGTRTDTNSILRTVLDAGGQVLAFKPDTAALNKAFMDLTTPGVTP